MSTDLILGTAGHIDHGKTSLIRALTGVDTDRLPEEQKRGITIELGFAELTLGDLRLGIVDVPGHERFVRNMLAGATGTDLALLVVAADDSVKPQTREHLEILRLLDLPSGVIALTKCDLADPDWMDLVEAEIGDLVEGTFLAEAPIIRTSAHTGEGLDELREALTQAARKSAEAAQRSIDGPFRMAIDRCFTIAGHGTVVTGSVASGQASIGDQLLIEPGKIEVRVRGLHNHDRTTETVQRGQRAAVNLAGVHHEQVSRGLELASPGHLVPSTLITVRLDMLGSAIRPLKNRARVRLHLGTAELIASVVLLEGDQLGPGESGLAQLYLSAPAVSIWNQPFVVRSESPVVTIGGGVVLSPEARKIRRREDEKIAMLEKLGSSDLIERSSAALFFVGARNWQPEDLVRTAGVHNFTEIADELRSRGDLQEIQLSPTRSLSIHTQMIEQLRAQVEKTLRRLHEEFPLRRSIDRSRLSAKLERLGSEVLLTALLEGMAKDRRVSLSDHGVALAGQGPQLSKNERQLIEKIIEQYRTAGVQPPTVAEIQKQTERNQASVPQLVELAVAEDLLVQVNNDFYMHRDALKQLQEVLSKKLSSGEGLTLSQIREILDTSRKYAVPICEYLDRIGFTKREGDVRVLVPVSS